MNHTDPFVEHRIDQLLHALATTPSPAGLEQRINARVAQRTAEALDRNSSLRLRLLNIAPASSRYQEFRPYAIAATALVTIIFACLMALAHTSPQQQIAHHTSSETITPNTSQNSIATTPATLHSHTALAPSTRPLATPSSQPAQDDPDAIALAETLAPSHPAPPQPLTMQEALLLRSTRPGQPIEVAELETRRESALTAIAATHVRASLREYIHGLLGPLATAQALTPPSPQPDDTQPVASAEPPSSK